MPFLVNRLPSEERARVKLVALLSPSERTDFEFHFSSLLGIGGTPGPYAVIPEIRKLEPTPVFAIFGKEEDDGVPNHLTKVDVKVLRIPGSHHFGRQYGDIARLILKEWESHRSP